MGVREEVAGHGHEAGLVSLQPALHQYLPGRVVWPKFGHHALASPFTKYKFLQMTNSQF